MRFTTSNEPETLTRALPGFLDIVGQDRWFRRIEQLDREQQASPYLWKIVSDYHWLEFAISDHADALERLGQPGLDLDLARTQAALHFAAAIVEIHQRLEDTAQRRLEGQLRDGLKAEGGYAALYLEVDMALRLMAAGFDVTFADLVGEAGFDLRFSRNGFTGEVECKSLSADAGRQIHRKDFYRFMEALAPDLAVHTEQGRQEVLVISLRDRLSPTVSAQLELRRATAAMLRPGSPARISRGAFNIERRAYADCLANAPTEESAEFYKACEAAFGPNPHIAGGIADGRGTLIVMRSAREDDTSKPWLEAMRKAATQLTGRHPGFIAVQFQGLTPADLMAPHLRRRAGILSYALFGHYGADHVSATYVSGYGAAIARPGLFGTPGFSIPNPRGRFAVSPEEAPPFLHHVADQDFADVIGAPLPAPNISYLTL